MTVPVTADSSTNVEYRGLSEAVAHLSLSRPDRANALGTRVVSDLETCVTRAADEGRRAIVLTAEGRTFSAGLDIKDAIDVDDEGLRSRFRALNDLFERLRAAPLLTVACVGGPAVGAGADLALACDLRLGSDAASFRFPGVRFGVLLGTVNLVARIGPERTLSTLLGDQTHDADSALRSGILSSVHAPGELFAEAVRTASLAASTGAELPDLLAVVRGRELSPAEVLERSMQPGLADRFRAYAGASDRAAS